MVRCEQGQNHLAFMVRLAATPHASRQALVDLEIPPEFHGMTQDLLPPYMASHMANLGTLAERRAYLADVPDEHQPYVKMMTPVLWRKVKKKKANKKKGFI